jgi:glycosyltransferase involved in cell wall biosynthesis
MKSWNMIKYLSQIHDVGLACPIKYGDEKIQKMLDQIKLKDFIHSACEVPRTPVNLLKSYLRNIPLNVYRSKSNEVMEGVRAVADDYEVILIDHYEAFQYIPPDYKGKVVFHAHNATYLMWERFALTGTNVALRWVARVEAFRVSRYEAQVCRRADLVFAAPNDIDMLSRLGVAKDKFAETYHLGDDSQLDLPSIRFDDTQNKILYVGTLNWEANVDGLLWFLAEIWPKIQGQDPGISLDIVGGNPDPRIVAACQTLRGVQLLGFVDDLEECFSQSRVFIAPLRFGSGIKVKVLNSMCRGLPIVTTTVGVEGLDVVNFKHIVVADTAAEYAQSVLQLMSDKAAWETIEIYSRKLIASKYTWKKVLGDMNIGVEKLNRPGGVV